MIKLSDFFTGDFLNTIETHKKHVQTIMEDYDVAIFMARKAICFYDALCINGEIDNTNCIVLSSRVTDFDYLDSIKNKKIAVIDDVVVRGKSISFVADKLSNAGIEADYYVVACDEQFAAEFECITNRLKKTFVTYTKHHIYQISGLITQYIEASMRTFNIDSPIYYLSGDDRLIEKTLYGDGAIDLTSGLQKKYGITCKTVYFSCDVQKDPICEQMFDESVFKIRFFCNGTRTIAVPFVLLPHCKNESIDYLYSMIKSESSDRILYNSNTNIFYENKYKLVSYCFSASLFLQYAQMRGLSFYRDVFNDSIIFGCNFEDLVLPKYEMVFLSLLADIKTRDLLYSRFMMTKFVRDGYRFVSRIKAGEFGYEDYLGNRFGVDDLHDGARLNRIVFSYADIIAWMKKNDDSEPNLFVYVSSVIDIFIDIGLIVPAILHLHNDVILRAYKMGEYSKLTCEQVNSFLLMLKMYQDDVGAKLKTYYQNTGINVVDRYLDKTEVEKLCVLFFINEINNRRFEEHTEFEENDYGIGYSFYGTRISSSKNVYEVSEESALITDFCEEEAIVEKNGQYIVDRECKIDDELLTNDCILFAADFALINDIFLHHPYEKNNNMWNQYIHSYDQYLTILAIGNSPKNQALSLVAEVNMIEQIKSEMFLEDISKLPIKKYKSLLSGINSGLWKYRCFKGDKKGNALEQTNSILCKIDINALRAINVASNVYDKGKEIYDFVDECGRFLYKSAYVYNELLRLTGRLSSFSFDDFDDPIHGISNADSNKELTSIFPVANYCYKPMRDYRIEITSEMTYDFDKQNIDRCEKIEKYVSNINTQAKLILDKCNLFLETGNCGFYVVKLFLVIHSNSNSLPATFGFNECKLEGVTKCRNTAVFSLNTIEFDEIVDGVVCETEHVGDCEYLLVNFDYKNSINGYAQILDEAKGSSVKKLIDNFFSDIHKMTYHRNHLFVLGKNDVDYSQIGDIHLSQYNTKDWANGFVLKEYVMKREKQVKNSIEYNVRVENGGNAIVGNENVGSITINSSSNEYDSAAIIKEFKMAVQEIYKTSELNEAQKDSIVSIFKEAENAVANGSEEQVQDAKKKFSIAKDFIISIAPGIISTLANMTQIALFFGLSPK